jgi:ubiquinone/menaquinone biosynthesis C-methylase UbiE
MEDEHQRSRYESWWIPGTVNYWRHTRLMAPALKVLQGMTKLSWLTLGDGAGMDAWRLLQAGFENVLATDLDDTVLRQTFNRGLITQFGVENAEALSLADNSVDFILCKEALHHMSRPYAAIYEMLRVARYGFVIVEPQDPWVDWPCRTDGTLPHYESVGNFVYQFSRRDIEKIGYGVNMRGVASRSMVDVYIEGCEYAYCVDGDPIWKKTHEQVDANTAAMATGTVKANYVQGVFFKNTVAAELFEQLQRENPEWNFTRTDGNPFLNSSAAT